MEREKRYIPVTVRFDAEGKIHDRSNLSAGQ